MAEITKRETRNRGERRPAVAASPPPRITVPTISKASKRKAASPPPPPIEPVRSRDPPGLPTLRDKQDLDLPNAEWKTVSESGVLAASLKLSMEKWRLGGCFEKYWVKNAVKKVHRDFQNPPTASMSRLGSAVMTIEPHSFEVILYAVKAPAGSVTVPIPKPTSSFTESIPPYKPPLQRVPSVKYLDGLGKAPAPAPAPAPPPVATASTQPKATPRTGAQTLKSIPAGNQPQSLPALQQPKEIMKPAPADKANGKPAAQPAPVDPSSNNPVIKELAHRASQDSGLKDLMKTVAQGGASQLQLKEFQRHIDEINVMLRQHAVSTSNNNITSIAPTLQNSKHPQHNQSMTWTQPITPNIKQEPGTHFQPSSNPKSKALPTTRPEISAVIFEILSGTGDRYLVPKKSLLEFRDGTRLAVLSFLVHLRGMNANGGFYKSEQEYCELITFKFLADRPGILEPLRKAIDPPDVVRRHMEDWADKMSVAEKAHLMLRLRSVPQGEEARSQTAAPIAKEEILTSEYEAPNSLFPMQRNAVVGRP